MASHLDVVALCSGGYTAAERDHRTSWIESNKAAETQFIRGYRMIPELIQQIQALMAADPDHPCLRTLEIKAHGGPTSMDSIWSCTISDEANQLKALRWCDEAHIYLAGCNTGLKRAQSDPGQWHGPLAKDLADAMAFDPGSFAVHLTVHGTKGYAWGGHLSGAAGCRPDHSETTFNGPSWDWPWNWFTTVHSETYEGAVSASGADVWQSFKNGSW